ncbi:hypothetical protein GCM10010216_69020 [Streptomyces flaveolus]|nr:hypothetical protein GCM10010216_69020 [Streptomyces flaveolus]
MAADDRAQQRGETGKSSAWGLAAAGVGMECAGGGRGGQERIRKSGRFAVGFIGAKAGLAAKALKAFVRWTWMSTEHTGPVEFSPERLCRRKNVSTGDGDN